MKYFHIVILSVFSLLIQPSALLAQKHDSIACKDKDIQDFFKKKDAEPAKEKDHVIMMMPVVYYNPTNGIAFGLGGLLGKVFGPKETTKVSSATTNVVFTTKKQFLAFFKPTVYTKNDKFFLHGDYRVYLYKNPTWGLGTNAPNTKAKGYQVHWLGKSSSDPIDAYQMSYRYYKFHQTVNRRIIENTFVGIGYHFDMFGNIEEESPNQITPHLAYSKFKGFDPTKYVTSGLSVNFIYDSRDNMINPYKGVYFNANYRINQEWLGSSKNSSQLNLEFRGYVSLSKKHPRHLIGFWAIGNFVTSGAVPYLSLSAIGEDEKSNSGRGYIAGRYRGEDLMYLESEYRFPITTCSNLVGGVIFVNASTASNKTRGVYLFDYIQPGVGAGIRVMFNKQYRTNISVDMGAGNNSHGLYFSGGETF